MSVTLDLDKYLDHLEEKLKLIKGELTSHRAVRNYPISEELIQFQIVMGIKTTIELLIEAAAQSKLFELEPEVGANVKATRKV